MWTRNCVAGCAYASQKGLQGFNIAWTHNTDTDLHAMPASYVVCAAASCILLNYKGWCVSGIQTFYFHVASYRRAVGSVGGGYEVKK